MQVNYSKLFKLLIDKGRKGSSALIRMTLTLMMIHIEHRKHQVILLWTEKNIVPER